MPEATLPIFVTATMARVPKAWTPCGGVVKMADGSPCWLLVAPLFRVPELQILIAQGA